MDYSLKQGRTAEDWSKPDGVEERELDAISGYESHDGFPVKKYWVIPSTVQKGPDPIHTKIKLCRTEDNKLATEVDIVRGEYNEREAIVLRENDPVSADGRNRWQEGVDAWIASLAGDQQGLYRPPTELCGSSNEEVWIRIERPEDHKDYEETNIHVEVKAASEQRVDRVELWVNGSMKEVLRSKPYTTNLDLPAGRYVMYAKGIREDGREGKTGDVHFGIGGVHWEEPAPTPSPVPSPSPVASPVPSPTPIVIIPTPSPIPGD